MSDAAVVRAETPGVWSRLPDPFSGTPVQEPSGVLAISAEATPLVSCPRWFRSAGGYCRHRDWPAEWQGDAELSGARSYTFFSGADIGELCLTGDAQSEIRWSSEPTMAIYPMPNWVHASALSLGVPLNGGITLGSAYQPISAVLQPIGAVYQPIGPLYSHRSVLSGLVMYSEPQGGRPNLFETALPLAGSPMEAGFTALPGNRLDGAALGWDVLSINARSSDSISAVNDLTSWLHMGRADVAALCGFSVRGSYYWSAEATIPRPSSVRRLFEVHSLVKALVQAIGRSGALEWLQGAGAGGDVRLNTLSTNSGPASLVREAAELLFEKPPREEAPRSEAEENELIEELAVDPEPELFTGSAAMRRQRRRRIG